MLYPYLPSFYGVTSPAQIITPLVYDESISYEQQIAQIFGKIKEISEAVSGYVTISFFNEFIKSLEKEEKEQTESLKKYVDTLNYAMKNYVDEAVRDISIGEIRVVDPSSGHIYPIEKALSNAYNDLRYWSWTWAEIDSYTLNKTWSEVENYMDGYTIRDIDLYADIIFNDNMNPIN